MPTNRIFIIDDEPLMVQSATFLLEGAGYQVTSSTNPKEGLRRIQESLPEMLLLDIRMPEMDGFEVLKHLKANQKTEGLPVIILSLQAQETNVVLGLELGADDFIRKPFRKQEFLSRIKAVLRRHHPAPPKNQYQHGPLHIDLSAYAAKINGDQLPLEPKEFQLLAFFCQREGQVLTRAVISENVWGAEFLPTSRTIDVCVTRLRRKLGDYGTWIKGLHGIGYRFEVEDP